MFVRYNPFILFGVMACGFFVSLVATEQSYYPVNSSILPIYVIDMIFCLFFLLMLVSSNHNKLSIRHKKLKKDIFAATRTLRAKVLICVLLSLLLLFNWQAIFASFVLNEKKEIFLTYVDYGYTYHIITPILLFLSASRISFGSGAPIIVVLAFFFFVASLQNKSLFLLIIYFCYLFWWLDQLGKEKKQVGNWRFVVIAVCMISLATFTVLLQERRGAFVEALLYSIEAFFRFKVIGFYLSDELFTIERGFQGAATALFGVVAEKISLLFSGGYGLLTDGFIARRIEIGPDNSQNAIYPWSVWLYAQMGVFGLVLKYIFLSSLFWIFLVTRFNASLLYLMLIIIFESLFRHPFMNVTDLYFFIAFLLLDIYLLLLGQSRRVRQGKIRINRKPAAVSPQFRQ